MRRMYGAAAVAVLTGVVAVGVAPAASADVDKRGTCSAASTWTSSLDLERGTFDVEFEVRTATVGQRWKLTVKQNGSRVYTKTRRAKADDDRPGAEVQWELRRSNHPNMPEVFDLRAKNLVTGEVCKTSLRE